MTKAENSKLNNVSKTMLMTLYARAKESQKKNHKIYDKKAIEIISKMNYDFSAADKDLTMSTGVIARTILLDKMLRDWLFKNPCATVINIASGMDTRFYRIENQNIRKWYNVDLSDAISVRELYINEDSRVKNISSSAMDEKWATEINETSENVLFIVEGLSMYLSEDDIKKFLSIVDKHFRKATIFIEILSPKFVKKDIEKSISKSGAVFTFGAASGKEIALLSSDFTWKGDRSLVEGMEVIFPIFKVIGKIKAIRNISNKVAVLEKIKN